MLKKNPNQRTVYKLGTIRLIYIIAGYALKTGPYLLHCALLIVELVLQKHSEIKIYSESY